MELIIILLYVVTSIATIMAWISYTTHKIHDPEDYRGCNDIGLCLAILFTLATYCFFAATIYVAKRKVKTFVPAKVETIITDPQESDTVKQMDTIYVYKFHQRKI